MLSNSDADGQHHLLILEISVTLQYCGDLIMFVDNHLSRLEWDDMNSLTFQSKATVVVNESTVRQWIGCINDQSIALSLFLSALAM